MKRVRRRSSRSIWVYLFGCLFLMGGCVVVSGVGLIIFWDVIVRAGAQAAGFQPAGQTDQVFAQNTPVPVPVLSNPTVPESFSIGAAGYGQQTLPNNSGASLIVGSSETGQSLATVTSTEAELQALCAQYSPVCTPQGDGTVRNARVDLRPGGAVVYGDVNVNNSGLFQEVGVVMQLDNTSNRFVVSGVDVNGTLFSAPPNELGALVNEAERAANDLLARVTLNAAGGAYTLDSMSIDDQQLTLILR